jgi:hypothetical protein
MHFDTDHAADAKSREIVNWLGQPREGLDAS